MTRKIILLFLLIVHFTSNVDAQLFSSKNKFPRKGEEAETFEKAEAMFEDQNYSDALVEYEKLEKDNPEELIIVFRLGVCYLQLADKIEKALDYLKKIDYELYANENVEFYLAQAYHKNSKYQDALTHFEAFKKNKNSDKDMKNECERYITNCKHGVELSKNMLPYIIKNVGAPINTNASEYAPVITSDESMMTFTYRGPKSMGGLQAPFTNPKSKHGEYYEDVFFSTKKEDGYWGDPNQFPAPINNDQNNATVSIAGDGQQMFLFNSVPGDLGSISSTKLYGKEWTAPELVPGGVNSEFWEGHISLSSDKKYMIFASEREGGLGGIDLYSAELQSDFTWGNIKNLGPEINTEEDEHGPFIHPSGQFFVFSSKGHNSVGGYDLFKCLSVNDSTWSNPENMGLPLNTPLDDVFYVISGDGKHGYYSSGKAGGFGGQDIYMTTPSIFGINIYLAEVKGIVTLNDQPVTADIKISMKNPPELRDEVKSNAETGKYLADLEAGKEYEITFTVPGLAPQTRTLDTRKLNDFKVYEINVQFYKKDVAEVVKVDSIPPKTEMTIEELLTKYADYENGELTYHVQIGAYNFPDNFRYQVATKFGKVEKQKLDDNITRFVIGSSHKLSEMRALCKKIVDAGITDAFVTGEYRGKRYMLRDIALNKFFSEQ